MAATDDQLIRRAIAAHARASDAAEIYEQPNWGLSDVEELDGKRYVVLRNYDGILQVYRVRPVDGVLRAMKRWPKKLETSEREGKR